MKCSDHSPPIHFPFRLKDRQPDHCGYPGFVVSCNDRHETVLDLPIPVKFFVPSIDYKSQEIEVLPYIYDSDYCLLHIINISVSPFHLEYTENYTLFNCSSVGMASRNDYGVVPCLSSSDHQIYAVLSSENIQALQSCTKMYNVLSVPSIMSWSQPNCTKCEAAGKMCRLKNNNTKSEVECIDLRKGSTLGSLVFLLLVAAAYKIYSYDRNERENRLKIERFLEDYVALKPSRYSYADIKRITHQFKENLGQGAYGTVFKGKLSSECFVAVKVLNSSAGNGEEFINEVGTMGHIHHVNVVRMVGFCADGFRRALVYEFLPNGSLHDYISSEDNRNSFLGWDKLHGIALGIAKGIEYLHQGCDQRIMHFDIKPQNVLLDHNFTPKLSDFGLAKLCSKDQSIVSMTTARGTMGYIAPEVFSRNFGNVSYKSDVYSFGMLLLEMVGGRSSIGATTMNANEVYYLEAIYNLVERGEGLTIHMVEEGDAKIQRKLAIIGLWCIQWHPVDRPPMKVVVQMLDGEENLTIPPNPFGSTSVPARTLNRQLETIVELA
ncbi:rust resistance kinase Lr10-like [Rosa rugosa]|uniref:rust resistance kinase Lr10-like n=1 Tax=Rosa rugosa TaxID=74645 RepID=UPI002B411322|nr:rust resistance kinase Lr10-like [Rosa rugosa]